MMQGLAQVVAVVAVVLTGSMAGVFLAFSTSVVPGLNQVAAGHAVAAMRGSNRAIMNPLFFAFFFLSPVAAGAAGAFALFAGHTAAGWLAVAAALVYLVGAFVVTMVANVPLNTRLEAGELPGTPEEADALWRSFAPGWQRWNIVRTVNSMVSVALLAAALLTLA